MTLLSELAPDHIDKYGLLLPGKRKPDHADGTISNDHSGNGLLHTSQFYCLATAHLDPTKEELIKWKNEFHDLIRPCRIEAGLYGRWPEDKHTQMDKQDDYIGLAAASKRLDDNATVANHILEYGESHGFNYNNVNPGEWTVETWLGRSVGFVVHLKDCAGKAPNGVERFISRQSQGLSWSRDKEEVYPKLLAHMIAIYGSEDKDLKKDFRVRVARQYEDVVEMYKIYFGEKHPIVGLFK